MSSTTATEWPEIEKTPQMVEIERAFDRDIRDIILDSLREGRTANDITYIFGDKIGHKLHESTVSQWIRRLGITRQAKKARVGL